MNFGQGTPIELDCASHNGVDDMRMIQDECKTRPLIGNYKIFILDECHCLTPQAWSSLLKILEEPPEYVIFLFCTTDPQKIMGTILSRVQRFDFHRISAEGIVNRLKHILNGEQITTYENEAIAYIARLAKGGMRDAITTLEKCLDYNRNLTLDNVLKVTSGGVTEENLLYLLKYILDKDCGEALIHFDKMYMSGADVALILKLFIEFLQNCTKYLITHLPNLTTLSDKTIKWLDVNGGLLGEVRNCLIKISEIRTGIGSEDLKVLMESWIIKICM
jgi:DNA polymerase-3 subunit gamma/tau